MNFLKRKIKIKTNLGLQELIDTFNIVDVQINGKFLFNHRDYFHSIVHSRRFAEGIYIDRLSE